MPFALSYAILAHLMSVPKLGGLPCISRPILKIFAANQIASAAAARPTTMVSSTYQNGGGESDASRAIIANVLTGGMKLTTTLNVELGARPMMGVRM